MLVQIGETSNHIMFHLLQPKYRSCDRCHGLQYLDAVDDCWICLQCAERNYILTEDEELERQTPDWTIRSEDGTGEEGEQNV